MKSCLDIGHRVPWTICTLHYYRLKGATAPLILWHHGRCSLGKYSTHLATRRLPRIISMCRWLDARRHGSGLAGTTVRPPSWPMLQPKANGVNGRWKRLGRVKKGLKAAQCRPAHVRLTFLDSPVSNHSPHTQLRSPKLPMLRPKLPFQIDNSQKKWLYSRLRALLSQSRLNRFLGQHRSG